MLTIIPPTLYGCVDDVSCVTLSVIVEFRVIVFSCVIVIVECWSFLFTFSPLEDSALKQA